MAKSLLTGKTAVGAIFSHPRIQTQGGLEDLDFCGLGNFTNPENFPELRNHPIKVFFDNKQLKPRGRQSIPKTKSKQLDSVQTEALDFVFFELDPSKYPLPSPTKVYWVIARDEEHLDMLFDRLDDMDRLAGEAAPRTEFYAVKLGDFLRKVIWQRSEYAGSDSFVRVNDMLITIDNDPSNASEFLFHARDEDGLLQKGLIGMLSADFRPRIWEMLISCYSGDKGFKVAVDRYGRFKAAPYKRAQSLLPFLRVVSQIARESLLKRVADHRHIEEAGLHVPDPF